MKLNNMEVKLAIAQYLGVRPDDVQFDGEITVNIPEKRGFSKLFTQESFEVPNNAYHNQSNHKVRAIIYRSSFEQVNPSTVKWPKCQHETDFYPTKPKHCPGCGVEFVYDVF